MEVAWVRAREAVKVVVKVDVKGVKAVANKHAKRCVATLVVGVVEIHAILHVVGTVTVPVALPVVAHAVAPVE